jgi:hypothetical protein
MAPITARELNRATLARQGLLEPITARSVAVAVERLGSLQAQHPEWPPVALAARAATPRTADLAGALRRRTVVRSSLMRVTIHIVSAADLWPMFTVMQPLRLAMWQRLTKADPMTSRFGKRLMAAHEVAIAALRERPRSSLELDRLMAAEVGAEASSISRPAWREPDVRVVVRAAWRHFAAFVPLVHVPWAGEGYGRSQYALATDWLGMPQPQADEAEARAMLARRYFAAFGPSTVEDLVAYVGRGSGGIRPWRDAVASLGDELVALKDDAGRTLHDLETSPRPGADADAPPRLLARWDSILLSHAPKARARIIADRHRATVFSKNADVLPTILLDGFVGGTWDLSRRDGTARIDLRPFQQLGGTDRAALEAEAERILALVEPAADRREVRLGR